MREISTSELHGNLFDKIDKEWFLLAAGDAKEVNMMTCSWGTVGELWGKRVAVAYVRKTRHTFTLLEKNGYFTLNFFGKEHRDALALCGSRSGRDIDKVAATGLTPVCCSDASDVPYFAEAQTVFVCRKLYADFIRPECFCDPSLDGDNYAAKDYHKFYVGEILYTYTKEE